MKTDIFNTDRKYDIIYADPPWKYADNNCQGWDCWGNEV